jgi:hypothetical protein
MIFDEGVFDEDLIEDFLQHYTVDAIIEAVNQPVSYSIDAYCGDNHTLVYRIDGVIRQPRASSSYLLDAILIMEKNDPRFQESIINAIIHSYSGAVEELRQAIATMGLRLQLPYAISEDLDQYWAKMLGLRRRYGEPDEDFRSRLITRLAIMKSSGTKAECETILNRILGMQDAVDLKTYWPAEVRVNWTSFQAMITAEEKYESVKAALDTMLAAGVSWSTAFPYKQYNVDALLEGRHSVNCSVDCFASNQKSALYLVRTDIFDTGSASAEIDACLETMHQVTERLDALVHAWRTKAVQVDANIEEPHREDYSVDSILKRKKTLDYNMDMISEADRIESYRIDGMAEGGRRSSYLVMVAISA